MIGLFIKRERNGGRRGTEGEEMEGMPVAWILIGLNHKNPESDIRG